MTVSDIDIDIDDLLVFCMLIKLSKFESLLSY